MRESPDRDGISRRSAIKQLSAVGIGIGAFGTGTVAAEDGDKEIPYDGFTRPYPDKSATVIDSSIRGVTNHPEMLFVSDESMKRHLESSDLDGRAFSEARDYLVELRKQYPVERVRDGQDTVIRLAPEAETETIYPERGNDAELTRHRNVLHAFNGGKPGDGHKMVHHDEVGTQWSQGNHRDITDALLDSAGKYNSTIVAASDDPDDFGEEARGQVNGICDQIDAGPLNGVKDTACGYIKEGLDVFHTNYAQYHDPSIASIPLGPLGSVDIPAGIGKAPTATNTFYYAASAANDDEKFGWSLHYLEDMSQPLHVGMGLEQAGFEISWSGISKDPKYWLHYGFEGLVNEYWNQDPSFSFDADTLKETMKNGGTAGYVYPKSAAENMASTATKYASDIYYEILENESNDNYNNWDWYTKYTVYKDLANCFSELGYLGRGMIDKYY